MWVSYRIFRCFFLMQSGIGRYSQFYTFLGLGYMICWFRRSLSAFVGRSFNFEINDKITRVLRLIDHARISSRLLKWISLLVVKHILHHVIITRYLWTPLLCNRHFQPFRKLHMMKCAFFDKLVIFLILILVMSFEAGWAMFVRMWMSPVWSSRLLKWPFAVLGWRVIMIILRKNTAGWLEAILGVEGYITSDMVKI